MIASALILSSVKPPSFGKVRVKYVSSWGVVGVGVGVVFTSVVLPFVVFSLRSIISLTKLGTNPIFGSSEVALDVLSVDVDLLVVAGGVVGVGSVGSLTCGSFTTGSVTMGSVTLGSVSCALATEARINRGTKDTKANITLLLVQSSDSD